jgi:hypothetical protein
MEAVLRASAGTASDDTGGDGSPGIAEPSAGE